MPSSKKNLKLRRGAQKAPQAPTTKPPTMLAEVGLKTCAVKQDGIGLTYCGSRFSGWTYGDKLSVSCPTCQIAIRESYE